MDAWTLKKGYPVVTISRNENELTLTQDWFLLNPQNTIQNTTEYDTYKWYIPFTFTTQELLNWDMKSIQYGLDLNSNNVRLLFLI